MVDLFYCQTRRTLGRSSGNTQNSRNRVESLKTLSTTSICREGSTFSGLSTLALLCKYWMQFIFGGKVFRSAWEWVFLWLRGLLFVQKVELKGHCFGLTNHEKSSITAEMQRPPMHHSVSSKDELGWKNVFVLLVLVLVGVIGCSQNGWKATRLWSDVCFLLWTFFFVLRTEILQANIRRYHSRLNYPSHGKRQAINSLFWHWWKGM